MARLEVSDKRSECEKIEQEKADKRRILSKIERYSSQSCTIRRTQKQFILPFERHAVVRFFEFETVVLADETARKICNDKKNVTHTMAIFSETVGWPPDFNSKSPTIACITSNQDIFTAKPVANAPVVNEDRVSNSPQMAALTAPSANAPRKVYALSVSSRPSYADLCTFLSRLVPAVSLAILFLSLS